MRAQWYELDRRIAEFDKELTEWARDDEAARRLRTIPGIGVLNATALVAAIGHGESFARGRDLAAWLGLVPRQVTTGGKPRLVAAEVPHDRRVLQQKWFRTFAAQAERDGLAVMARRVGALTQCLVRGGKIVLARCVQFAPSRRDAGQGRRCGDCRRLDTTGPRC